MPTTSNELHSPICRREILLRKFIKARIWLGLKFYRRYGVGLCRIGPSTMMKSNGALRYAEVTNMRFIAENTTIPVPRVYDFFFLNKRPILVMEFIDAPALSSLWPSMPDDDRQNILSQIQGYINQLRQLVPPHPGYIETADGSPCFDPRQQGEPFGPFSSVEAFHGFLNHEWMRTSERYQEYRDPFEKIARRPYRTVFTHGDLAPRNILVKDGKVVAILDWETAGWYPEYWEYARLRLSNYDAPDWEESLHKVMEPYHDECEVENILSSIFTRC